MVAGKPNINVFWFRRDLRLNDNCGLCMSLNDKLPVLPIFIFDTDILDGLSKIDIRVTAIYSEISRLKNELEKYGSSLKVMFGTPLNCFRNLIESYNISAVYTNNDYEPYGIERDDKIKKLLNQKGIQFKSYKDHVIFEKNEIVKDDGKPYTIYTPFMKKWKEKYFSQNHLLFPSEKNLNKLFKTKPLNFPELHQIGFMRQKVFIPEKMINENLIKEYHLKRDFPAENGTSRLSYHLRFGTISIRQLVYQTSRLNDKYLNELIWREFYMMIIWHFPYVIDRAFKKRFDAITWRNSENDFDRWENGLTGFPLVDAGMRQLNETGYMHNRVRMVVASFLVKNLLIDWRRGEAYFAEKLLDFELSSNNGGWQWAAGTGADAAPFFRVFNPEVQAKKYDPQNKYIIKWLPEYGTSKYPKPMIDLKVTRQIAVESYKKAKMA